MLFCDKEESIKLKSLLQTNVDVEIIFDKKLLFKTRQGLFYFEDISKYIYLYQYFIQCCDFVMIIISPHLENI